MFYIQEFEGKFFVIESDYEWVADIRDSLEDAEKSASYYTNHCSGDAPFPDLV